MLHSLKANLVNFQDGSKQALHANCYIYMASFIGEMKYISDAWPLLVLVLRFYQNRLS